MTARMEMKSEDRADETEVGKEVATIDAAAAGSAQVKGTIGWTKLNNREKC